MPTRDFDYTIDSFNTKTKFVDIKLYDYDRSRKIAAIRFVHALITLVNPGCDSKIRTAKNIVDEWAEDEVLVMEIPTNAFALVIMAAKEGCITLTPPPSQVPKRLYL